MTLNHVRSMRLPTAVVLCFSLVFLDLNKASAQGEQLSVRLSAPILAQPAKAPLLSAAKLGSRVVAVGIRGLIIASDDEGVTWEQKPSPTDVTLTDLVFVESGKGFAVGHEESLLRTDDGGASWRLVRTDASGVPLLRIRFLDAQRGFALGGRGVIYGTSDGGSSWTRTTVTADDGFDPHLFDLASTTDGRLLIAAEGGRLFRSSDGGRNWAELQSPYTGSFFGLVTFGQQSVLVYGMLGHAFLSRTGGDSWEELSTGIDQSFFSAAVTGEQILLAGADGAVVTTPLDDPGVFTVHDQPGRPTISGLLSTSGGWLLASDRGLRQVATPFAHPTP
jgi:photosystem II stability/assembly factor-like uncharacterized protein